MTRINCVPVAELTREHLVAEWRELPRAFALAENAHMLGNAQGAFAEVVASNYSKFEGGVCQLDSTGKVIKGPGYFKPELSKFLRGASDE